MPGTSTARGPRVLNVAAGVETSESPAPRRDARHDALRVLVGKWINAGHTIGAPEAIASTSPLSAWLGTKAVGATGSSLKTVASSASATHPLTDRRERCRSASRSSA